MIKAVIFDMDGLMFDTERVAGDCFKQAGKEFGYQITDEIRNHLLGVSAKGNRQYLLETFGEDFPYTSISKQSAIYRHQEIQENGLPMKHGLLELLTYLQSEGIQMAVASSSNKKTILDYLSFVNIADYFDFVIGGDEVENSKPNPEIFERAYQAFSILSTQALVLEDSRNGILAAHAANIPVICVPDLVTHPQEITDLTYATVDDLHQVIAIIKENKKG